MNKTIISGLVVVMATAATALVGCGGGEGASTQQSGVKGSSSSSGSSKPDTDTDNDATDPAPTGAEEACVPEGTKANAKGVGSYCSKTVKCSGDTFCTGDFGAPVGAQFCTVICSADSDCGEGARCFHEGRGNACVPNACKTDN